jgi:nitroreductase
MKKNRIIHVPEAMDFSPEEVRALIQGRRTVKPKQYSDRIIDRSIIDDLLENANWAPTHGMTEPWRFRVYAGDARAQLAEKLIDLYTRFTPEEEHRADKIEKLKSNPRAASHVVAIFLQRLPGKIPEIEEVEAVACAVQNMALSAHAHGVAAFWSTGLMIYSDIAREIFAFPENQQLLGFLYLGYPRGELPKGVRQSVQDKVEWVGEEPPC